MARKAEKPVRCNSSRFPSASPGRGAAGRGPGGRDPGQRRLPGQLHPRKPVDSNQRDPPQLCQRGQETAVSRFVVHLPAPLPPADERSVSAHRPPGADQFGLCRGQDRRHRDVPQLQPPARHLLFAGDADQPVRPQRQFPSAGQPRAAGPDPPFSRGQDPARRHRWSSGEQAPRAANFCMPTTWPMPAFFCWKMPQRRRWSISARAGT